MLRDVESLELSMHDFDIQNRMHFIPVVVSLAVISAHTVYANSASDRRRGQFDRINDLADYEGARPPEIVYQLEAQVAVFVVDHYLGDVSFGHHVRISALSNIGDVDRMKLAQVQSICDQLTGRFFAHRTISKCDDKRRNQAHNAERR